MKHVDAPAVPARGGQSPVRAVLAKAHSIGFGAEAVLAEQPTVLRSLTHIAIIESARGSMERGKCLEAHRILHNALWNRETKTDAVPEIETEFEKVLNGIVLMARKAISAKRYTAACELLEGIRGRIYNERIANEVRGLLFAVYTFYAQKESKEAEKEKVLMGRGRRISFAATYWQQAYGCALTREEKNMARTAAVTNYLKALELKAAAAEFAQGMFAFEAGIERDFYEAARLANSKQAIESLVRMRELLANAGRGRLHINLIDLVNFYREEATECRKNGLDKKALDRTQRALWAAEASGNETIASLLREIVGLRRNMDAVPVVALQEAAKA